MPLSHFTLVLGEGLVVVRHYWELGSRQNANFHLTWSRSLFFYIPWTDFLLWLASTIIYGINVGRRKDESGSQEHLGAPIYWSRAPIYWSPKILFSIFWGRMKRESSDKTRFCVSLEGLPNGLGTFSSPWFMFENKTKNMFLTRRGSNILEPGRQYIGAP